MSNYQNDLDMLEVSKAASEKAEEVFEATADGAQKGYKAIENGVVKGYKAVETAVVGAYTKIEDGFVGKFLTHEGETVAEAKARLQKQAAHGGRPLPDKKEETE